MTHTAAGRWVSRLKTQILLKQSVWSEAGYWAWLFFSPVLLLASAECMQLGVYYWKLARSPPAFLPQNVLISEQIWIWALQAPVSPPRCSGPCQRWTHSGRLPHERSAIRFDCSFFFYLVDNCSSSGSKPRGVKSLIKYHTQETGRLIRW